MLKTLHRKTIGDLKANWKQFLAVWFVITLGTAFYGAMYPSGMGLVDSIYRTYDQLGYMDYQIKLAPRHQKTIKKVQQLPGVAAAEGRLVVEAGVQLDPQHDYLTSLRLISISEQGGQVNQSDITEGRAIQDNMEILLLARFADRHNIHPGDVLKVWINGQPYEFTVVGLVFNPEYLVAGRSREVPFPAASSFGVAWMRYEKLAGLAGLDGMINEIVLRLQGSRSGNQVDQDGRLPVMIEQALRGYEDVEVFSRVQTASGGVIDANVNGNLPVLVTFSLLFLIGGLSVTGILLGRMVQSERQRIGTLRAMGVTRREIIQHYLTFGLLVGLSGGLVGSVLGYLNSFLVMYPFVATIAGGYLPGFTNQPQFLFILIGFVVVMAGTTLAGIYPAWVESGTPPGLALRPPTPRTPSAISRLSLGFLPLSLRQTVRNLLRVPGRSFGTALGVMAGSIMVFSSLAIIDTIDISFESYYASGRFDLRVLTNTFQPARDLENKIGSIRGVQAVQAVLYGPVKIRRPGQSDFSTLGMAVDEKGPFLQLETLLGQPAFSSPDGIWIGHNLARVLDVGVGDSLTIEAMDEVRQAKVLGVVSQVFGSPTFIPRSQVVAWMPGRVYLTNAALLRVDKGQKGAVLDELADVPGVIAVEDYPLFVQDIRDYVQYWRQTSQLFLMFGLLLTLAVILNTVSASLHEQQSELSILRSLGTSQREIFTGVMLELLIMGGLGILIGVPLGRELGFYLTRSYNTDFYGLVPGMRMISYWVGVFGMLLAVLLAAIPGLRSVQRIDLGQVSKSQSI